MFLVDVSYSFTELFHRSSLKIRKCQYIYVFVHSFSLRRIFCKLTFFSIELLNSEHFSPKKTYFKYHKYLGNKIITLH